MTLDNAPRHECFMAETELEYSYAKEQRKYVAIPFHSQVKEILYKLNKSLRKCDGTMCVSSLCPRCSGFGQIGHEYNACFLNRYDNEKNHLGWHSDDFINSDLNHPIAVISFGAEREIWTKKKDYKGVIPKEDRYSLYPGSLFIMPGAYQADHLHRIPKHDRPCGSRVSLTYRKFI